MPSGKTVNSHPSGGAASPPALSRWLTPKFFFSALAFVTLVRIIVLFLAAPEIGQDEAQYWYWSQHPDFGYYSKPPLIAWAIGLSTTLFGDAPWALRLPAPLFQSGAAIALFFTGKRLFGTSAGVLAGLSWLVMPGVSLSSTLIATDAPMLFFWSWALYFCFSFLDQQPDGTSGKLPFLSWNAALLGGSIGLGLMSKYAMIYFPVGIALALVISAKARRSFFSVRSIPIALIAVIIILPNIIWNAQNDFQTLSHTADNANWGADLFHPVALAAFVGGQFGVVGPVLMIAMLMASFQMHENKHVRMLLAFAVPVLVIVSLQAFLSRAHANWGAAAYPAMTLIVAAWAVHSAKRLTVLMANTAFHAAVMTIFMAVIISPALADDLGFSPSLKRLRGWAIHGADLTRQLDDYSVVMTDDREVMSGMVYYARGHGTEFISWDSNNRIDHHFEAFSPFDPELHAGRILYVTTSPDAAPIGSAFGEVNKVGQSEASLGRGRSRTLYFYSVSRFVGAGGARLKED